VNSNNRSRRGWQERFKDEFGRSERSRRGRKRLKVAMGWADRNPGGRAREGFEKCDF
jgi:hypothetical protein